MYRVTYSEDALRDLKKIEIKTAQRIVKKILFFSRQKNVLKYSKPLKGLEQGLFRFRIGDFRAIFLIDKNGRLQILFILKIKHRKDIYLS